MQNLMNGDKNDFVPKKKESFRINLRRKKLQKHF